MEVDPVEIESSEDGESDSGSSSWFSLEYKQFVGEKEGSSTKKKIG